MNLIVILTSNVPTSISFLPELIIVVNFCPTRTHPYHRQSSNGVDPDTHGKRDVADREEEDSEGYVGFNRPFAIRVARLPIQVLLFSSFNCKVLHYYSASTFLCQDMNWPLQSVRKSADLSCLSSTNNSYIPASDIFLVYLLYSYCSYGAVAIYIAW